MKIAALVLGLLGSLLVMALGAKWVTDYKKNEAAVKRSQELLQQLGGGKAGSPEAEMFRTLGRRVNAGYAMVLLGIPALLLSLLVFKLPKLAGAAMAMAALVPGVLAPPSLLFGCVLLLGALCAFLAKPRAASPAPAS
jgi:hypothetical protein